MIEQILHIDQQETRMLLVAPTRAKSNGLQIYCVSMRFHTALQQAATCGQREHLRRVSYLAGDFRTPILSTEARWRVE